jgi:hypothetical protein
MFVIASEARQSTADEQNNVLRKPLGLNDNAGDEPQFISWSDMVHVPPKQKLSD